MALSPEIELIEESVARRVLRIASPSYPVTPPDIVGREQIPRDALSAMEPAWTVQRQKMRAVSFNHLRDVYVSAEGLVFDNRFRLYRSTLAQHVPEQVNEALYALRERAAAGIIPSHAGPVLLCKKIGSYNYGHWMLEMLPRVMLARENLRQPDLRYLVHELDGPMRRVTDESLALAGVTPEKILRSGNEPHHFSDLFMIDGLSEHGAYMSPLCLEALERFAARVRTGPSERIFVTRAGARWRRFRNEDQLHEIAQHAGYSLVDPGAMSLPQQIMVFKGARHVAGVTGAGISNIAFCRPGASVRLFVPRSMPDTFFWFISQVRQHAYAEMRCPEVGLPPRDAVLHPSWNSDIRVTPAAFRRFISA